MVPQNEAETEISGEKLFEELENIKKQLERIESIVDEIAEGVAALIPDNDDE